MSFSTISRVGSFYQSSPQLNASLQQQMSESAHADLQYVKSDNWESAMVEICAYLYTTQNVESQQDMQVQEQQLKQELASLKLALEVWYDKKDRDGADFNQIEFDQALMKAGWALMGLSGGLTNLMNITNLEMHDAKALQDELASVQRLHGMLSPVNYGWVDGRAGMNVSSPREVAAVAA